MSGYWSYGFRVEPHHGDVLWLVYHQARLRFLSERALTGEVTQEISRDDRGLELTITPISEAGSERTGG